MVVYYDQHVREFRVKFIYSEKAAFYKISIVDLSYVVPVKSTVEILENFVAFPEYTYEFWTEF